MAKTSPAADLHWNRASPPSTRLHQDGMVESGVELAAISTSMVTENVRRAAVAPCSIALAPVARLPQLPNLPLGW